MSSLPTVSPAGGGVARVRSPDGGAAQPSVPAPPLDVPKTLSRIRREFFEMPGLCLTEPQAQRLWSLDRRTCAALLAMLVDANILVRDDDGRVMNAPAAGADEPHE